MIQHEFIAIDEGHAALLHINERDQSKNWIVPIGRPQSRDMQLVGSNRILIGHQHGYIKFDIATGRVAKEFAALEDVTAARRQPNGQGRQRSTPGLQSGCDFPWPHGVVRRNSKIIRRAMGIGSARHETLSPSRANYQTRHKPALWRTRRKLASSARLAGGRASRRGQKIRTRCFAYLR